MKKHPLYLLYIICFFCVIERLQSQQVKIATIAFYNLENLFDCEDNEQTFDNDYTPLGKNNWTEVRLETKLDKLSFTIAKVGADKTKRPPVLVGVAEVENRLVLERLIDKPVLAAANYGIAHFDSPDRRGIDVGLLYNRHLFKLTNAQKHRLDLKSELNKVIYTRDQLCVSGFLGSDLIYCIVNHWPSRRGGQQRSNPRRVEAAKLSKKIIDSIYSITKNARIIIMGDFNDNPNDDSFKNVLSTRANKLENIKSTYIYNPMESMYKKGWGSLGYRDQWSLFDQILISNSLLDTTQWHLWNTHIYSKKYLKNSRGKYKGYPKRTFGGGKYQEGYSDHFPVYMYLIKKVTE